MDFIADTDRTDKPIPFVVFKPEIIDAVYVGNSFPADIEIQHKDDKTESVVVKAYLPDKTEIYRNGRETISSVSLMLSDKVEIPQDIVNSHWDLVRKYQKEALR